jgi:ketosteroid isomerase-like protein
VARGRRDSLEIHYEIVDVSELGDRVVAVGHIRIRGTESGAETRSPIGYVFEFKDGKVIRMQSYFDPNQGLEAAGARGSLRAHSLDT